MEYNKLCACKLGVAGGLLWGLSLLVVTLISVWTGYAEGFLNLISGVYPGYEITIAGSFIGFFYGFADGFFGLAILALIYNFLLKHCSCCCKCKK